MSVRTWGEFAKEEPDLAAFGAELLLGAQVAYLATVRPDGVPRVHPITPILTDEGLFLFMEPTSPKGHDQRSGSGFSMHNAVPDMNGTGGEFIISGSGFPVESPKTRATVSDAAGTSRSTATCCSSSSSRKPGATATATCSFQPRDGGRRSPERVRQLIVRRAAGPR